MQENKKNILLSRKYRPKNFNQLREQEVLVTTLSNAIINDKLPQSYLFTGIRGVGKTTTARIIAKTINCTSVDIQNRMPISCEKCMNCISCNDGNHPDIIEIDAASRTGVDDIRFIIENAEYKPMMARYKVFIIDEVHMLSKNAFNALLKLLEEPPLHCIFIFATTEIHKIPLTIISRCQRFDLKRFSKEGLVGLLVEVAIEEQLDYDIEAFNMIATKGDGSARDSLSLLDQASLLASSSGGKISKNLVEEMVSAVNFLVLVEFLNSIANQNSREALKTLEKFYSTNTDFHNFLIELLSIISYIAKRKAVDDYVLEEYKSYQKLIDEISQKFDMQILQILWKLTYNTQHDLKSSMNQLQNMEMLALKMIYAISQIFGENLPRRRLEIEKREENASKENFSEFLKFLSENREFQIIYFLLNSIELVSEDDGIILGLKKPDLKIEEEIGKNFNFYSKEKASIKFVYKDNIVPYREKVKKEFLSEEIIQKISKNFSDMEIVDILVGSSKEV